MGWESHHSRSTQPRHLGQHSANLSPATPMCLLSSTDSDLFLSAQGTGFNRPYALNNYFIFWSSPYTGKISCQDFTSDKIPRYYYLLATHKSTELKAYCQVEECAVSDCGADRADSGNQFLDIAPVGRRGSCHAGTKCRQLSPLYSGTA